MDTLHPIEKEVDMSKSHSFWGVLVTALVLGLGGCFPIEPLPIPTASPPPAGPRQIAKNTLGLHEYWRVPHTCLGVPPDHPPSSLAAVLGRVVCLYYDPANNTHSVQVFEADRGSLSWEIPGKPSTGLESVFADAKRVYFTSMFEISAYDLDNGKQLWDKLVPIKGGLFHPDQEKLHVLENGRGGPWMLYTFDGRTGDMLSSESVPTDGDFILFAKLPQLDLYLGFGAGLRLRAVDSVTRQVRWLVQDPKSLSAPSWPPVLLDDVLLADQGQEIVAFDVQSGQVRWRSGNSASTPYNRLYAANAVVINGSLYALRYDGRLVRLDPKTGRETGYIQFMPPLPDRSPIDKFFALATNGKMLFVSFDDSNELIALGP
jgi:outer membrane protein assembly factor BamB